MNTTLKLVFISIAVIIMLIGCFLLTQQNVIIEIEPLSPKNASSFPNGDPIAQNFPSQYLNRDGIGQIILQELDRQKREGLIGTTKNLLSKSELSSLIDILVKNGYIVTHYSNAAIELDKRTIKENKDTITITDTGSAIYVDKMPDGKPARLKTVIEYRYVKASGEFFVRYHLYD